MSPVQRSAWYRRTPILALALLCCWPVGIALVWLFAPWSRRTKVIVTTVALVFGLPFMLFSARAQTPSRAEAVAPRAAVTPPAQVAAAPTVAPTQTPVPPTATPEPTAAPPAAPEKAVVKGAGAEGVNMRADPSATAVRVKLLKDGAQLEIVGEDRQADGRTWRNVKDSDGATGWVAAEFLVAGDAPAPPVAEKPAAPATTALPPPTAAPKPAAPTAAPKPVAPSGGIVCKDGYAWPGTTRQGACHGHGGIR